MAGVVRNDVFRASNLKVYAHLSLDAWRGPLSPNASLILNSEATGGQSETPGVAQNLTEARNVYKDATPSRLGETEFNGKLGSAKILNSTGAV